MESQQNWFESGIMFIEKRPTCVSVIGWAWIVIGGMMCVGALLGIAAVTLMSDLPPPEPFLTKIFPFLAIAQVGLGATALIAGINFLKLKAWARPILEGFTWFLLSYVVVLLVVMQVLSITMELAPNEPVGTKWLMRVMSLVICGMYSVPLVIMLRYLRGEKVRSALRSEDGNRSLPK